MRLFWKSHTLVYVPPYGFFIDTLMKEMANDACFSDVVFTANRCDSGVNLQSLIDELPISFEEYCEKLH